MAQKLNPFSAMPHLDGNGDPRVGALLFIYEAGSSTKITTTKDSAGASNHANPIVLNSSGLPGDGSGATQAIWQAAGVTAKLVLAPSDDTDPPIAAISTWDNIAGINDTTAPVVSQWISGATPTYVDATSFTLAGDQTSIYQVGRRLKTTNSGGDIYSVITATAYTSLTTITVANNSGTLDSGLSAVFYGILSGVNQSVPNNQVGSDVTSAAALTLGEGSYFDVTGTTAITSIVTRGLGSDATLQFDGILTLTHHATDLILPGLANITTAAGDIAVFYEYATGNCRLVSYTRASQRPRGLIGALVQRRADQVMATSVSDVVDFDTTVYDTDSIVSGSTFTIPAGMPPRARISVVVNSSSNITSGEIYINGAGQNIDYSTFLSTGTGTSQTMSTPIIPVAEGDVFDARTYSVSAYTVWGDLSGVQKAYSSMQIEFFE